MLAACVVLVPAAAVGTVGVPVNVGLARGAFAASAVLMTLFCTGFVDVLLNALSTVIFALLTAVVTNAVLAACVVLVPAAAVGTVGVPVNAGLARGAFAASAVLMTLFCTGFVDVLLNALSTVTARSWCV